MMASIKDCKEELWRIGQIYPTLGGLLQRETGGKTVQTTGHIWAQMLSKYELSHIEDVVDEYCSGRRSIPDPSDRLITELVQEVSLRQWREQRRFEQQEKYYGQKKMPWREKSGVPVCEAIRYIMRHGPVDEDQLKELQAWNRGGPVPGWVYERNEA